MNNTHMDSHVIATTARLALDAKLAAAVSRALGIDVPLLRWIPRPTGDVPVFGVPSHLIARAHALGLTVDVA